jgi:hypothetical protein
MLCPTHIHMVRLERRSRGGKEGRRGVGGRTRYRPASRPERLSRGIFHKRRLPIREGRMNAMASGIRRCGKRDPRMLRDLLVSVIFDRAAKMNE